tara:strand:+ start:84 stop:869 length:786 start_codon:yes stop_codon:yes gene_type:complete
MIDKYYILKLSFEQNRNIIETIKVYSCEGTKLKPLEEQNRAWLVQKQNEGYPILGIRTNEEGKYRKYGDFSYDGSYFSWTHTLPKNLPKRNVFVSYYHADDQGKRKEFDNLFGDLMINQSVMLDEINGENSDAYISRLINEGYMKDTTVLTVLLGPKTKCRMHVDWEISGALNKKVGERYAGLLGIRLPTHPDFGLGTDYNPDNYPNRLAANLDSGYAVLADWTEDRKAMQDLIEIAFANRSQSNKIKNAGILRLAENSCK